MSSQEIPSQKILRISPQTVKHGFYGRKGGVSTDEYASLNTSLSQHDTKENIARNRLRIKEDLNAESIVYLKQIHSPLCLSISGPTKTPAEADALVTTVPGIAIAVQTADCAPVLFYGTNKNGDPVIGAAHAGWKGALTGVLEATIKAMQTFVADVSEIQAAVGPCINSKNYEVSKGFERPFLVQNQESAKFFKHGKNEKLMFDLPAYCAWRLANAGLRKIALSEYDTYAYPEDYFSHRRMTHEGREREGRQTSAICIQCD